MYYITTFTYTCKATRVTRCRFKQLHAYVLLSSPDALIKKDPFLPSSSAYPFLRLCFVFLHLLALLFNLLALLFNLLAKMAGLIDRAKNYVSEKVANMPKPEASVTDVDFKRLSRDSVEYLAYVSVSNPYSHAIPICEISYNLKSDGRFVRSFTRIFKFPLFFDFVN